MSAVVMQLGEEAGTPAEAFHALLIELLEEQHGVRVAEVIDFELGLHDLQPAAQAGLKGELIASARLDNLLSCFVGLEALLGGRWQPGRAVRRHGSRGSRQCQRLRCPGRLSWRMCSSASITYVGLGRRRRLSVPRAALLDDFL